MKKLIGLLVIPILLSSCSRNESLNRDAADVEKVLQDLIADDNSGNLDGVMSHYATDATLLGPNSPSIRGIENIRTHYSNLFESSRFVDLKAVASETQVHGHLAVISGVNSGTVILLSDSSSVKIHSKFIMEFIKQNGAWKVHHLIWNDAGSDENISE